MENEPLLDDYYSLLGAGNKGPRFDHLLFHADGEGVYVPVEFDEVVYPEDEAIAEAVGGGTIGSSLVLLRECEVLANALGLPLEMDPCSKEFKDLTWDWGQGEARWQKYGRESDCCLALYHACRKSAEYKAAVVFQ